jgi:hypothetical protein
MIDIADPEKFRENIRVKLNAVIQNGSSPRTLKEFKLHHQRSHHQQSHKEWKKLGVYLPFTLIDFGQFI